MKTVVPAKQLPDFCGCNRDWVFRHLRYVGGEPANGKVVCYTCGRNKLFDYGFFNGDGVWKHESFGGGVWPIPADVIKELERGDAERAAYKENSTNGS